MIGRPLDKDLEKRLQRQVRLGNDADCFTLSEATDGAGRASHVVFGVILGTGVGGGISIGGYPWIGPNAISGEWGDNPLHWPLSPADNYDMSEEYPGRVCYCWKNGCIETFLSGPGLATDHEIINRISLEPPAIIVAASTGDLSAKATFQRYTDRLARALSSVINILDPDVIVLGGGLFNIQVSTTPYLRYGKIGYFRTIAIPDFLKTIMAIQVASEVRPGCGRNRTAFLKPQAVVTED